jgi:hypothetical protein
MQLPPTWSRSTSTRRCAAASVASVTRPAAIPAAITAAEATAAAEAVPNLLYVGPVLEQHLEKAM